MKITTLILVGMLSAMSAFAEHHEKKEGHDVEHSHVKGAKVDHAHDDGHHKPHDHKAHHPGHEEKKEAQKSK